MPLSNLPGTLGATRYAGSQPIGHPASKVTTGTLGYSRVPYVLGTLITRTSPGFNTARDPGTTRPRLVAAVVTLRPAVLQTSEVVLKQARIGTIQHWMQPSGGAAIDVTAIGWVLPKPGAGSFQVQSIGSAPLFLFYTEWGLQY